MATSHRGDPIDDKYACIDHFLPIFLKVQKMKMEGRFSSSFFPGSLARRLDLLSPLSHFFILHSEHQ
jgi:hypothetical protein